MQSSARVAVHGGDTNGTFDAKCIGHRRVMRLTSPSMEAHAAARPPPLVRIHFAPAAVRALGLNGQLRGGPPGGVRLVHGGRQLMRKPLGGGSRGFRAGGGKRNAEGPRTGVRGDR